MLDSIIENVAAGQQFSLENLKEFWAKQAGRGITREIQKYEGIAKTLSLDTVDGVKLHLAKLRAVEAAMKHNQIPRDQSVSHCMLQPAAQPAPAYQYGFAGASSQPHSPSSAWLGMVRPSRSVEQFDHVSQAHCTCSFAAGAKQHSVMCNVSYTLPHPQHSQFGRAMVPISMLAGQAQPARGHRQNPACEPACPSSCVNCQCLKEAVVCRLPHSCVSE